MLVHNILRSIIVLAASATALKCPSFYADKCGNKKGAACDPLETGKGWEVIQASSCLVRSQSYNKVPAEFLPKSVRDGKRAAVPWDARVRVTNWDTTSAQVSSTINNFYNSGNTNVMLWKYVTIATLKYFSLLNSGSPSGNGLSVTPQTDCSGDTCILSLILPSGRAKVNTVGADSSVDSTNYARADAFGINGRISLTDYGWVTWTAMLHGVNGALQTSVKASDGQWYGGKDGYVLAERSRVGSNGKEVEYDCVVIDLRSVVRYDYV